MVGNPNIKVISILVEKEKKLEIRGEEGADFI